MNDKTLPQINFSLCNRCSLCITQCPEDALRMSDQGPIFNDPITCTYCLDCESLCPTGAIRAPLTVTWGTKS